MQNKLSTFIADSSDPIYIEKQNEIDRITETCKNQTKTVPATKYSLLEQKQFQYKKTEDVIQEITHVLKKLDVYNIFTDTKFVTGFVKSASPQSGVDGSSPTGRDLQIGFEIDSITYSQTPAVFNVHDYARPFSGAGDRYTFYQIKSTSGGFVAYTQKWKPSSITEMQFLRNYYTDELEVSKIWWRIRPANKSSPHNAIPKTWAAFDGGSNTSMSGFCIFSQQQDEIYRKLSNTEKPTFSPGQNISTFTSLHSQYPVNKPTETPLVGFKSQYDLTDILDAEYSTSYGIISNTTLPSKFKIFVPPGVSFIKLEIQSVPGTQLQVKSKFGEIPPTDSSTPMSSMDSLIEVLDRIPNDSYTEEDLLLIQSNDQSVAQTADRAKTYIWFKPELTNTVENWLYCVVTKPEALLQARLHYIFKDVVVYKDWYSTSSWNTVGDPILLEEKLTNETESGIKVRGDHEVVTLQGWDGKTYINLKQDTDPLNVRLTAIAQSTGMYSTQFYDHASLDAKSCKEYKDLFGAKPKNFAPTFHSATEKADFWDHTKIPHSLQCLPVLRSYDVDTETVKYFAMIAYALTDESQTDSEQSTIYGGTEEPINELENNGDWINPPATDSVKPYLQSSKQEIIPIVMHLFQEITETEFNTHQYISETLPY